MRKPKIPSAVYKALIIRYLLWAYKSTRESYERIERKTTQLVVDEYLMRELSKDKNIAGLLDEFKEYIANKRTDEIKLKYTNAQKSDLNPTYLYLKHRLMAIEKAVIHFLGVKALKKIETLYEQEFTCRILESREH